MKINRNTVVLCVFAALQLVSINSFALTLGRVRGAALLGKELDLAVQVQFAPDEDMSSACFDADVSYGETPLERSRYTVSVQAGTQANTQVVRVQSTAKLDDAVLSINLRAACGPKASRRYVLLSEVTSELAAASPSYPGALGARNAAPLPAATKGDVQASQTQSASNAGTVAPAKPAAKSQKGAGTAAASAAARAAPAASTADKASRSRLEVSAAVIEDLQKRVDDIAKWQASNGSAEDAQKNDARAKALEAGIRDLQRVTAKNQQSIQLVAAAVEDAASQNYGRTLVYLLVALLLVCMAALAYAMKRLRTAGSDSAPWWSAGDERAQVATVADKAPPESPAKRPQASVPAPLVVDKATTTPAAATTASLVSHLTRAEDSGFDALATVVTEHNTAPQAIAAASQPKPKVGRPDFAQSGHGTLRAINTREMLDVRQQADFFMALGQHDEAVRLLESNIRGSADANPLVYLDLLKILHTLSRRTDFERYREEFNLQFTGRIPEYADFLAEGNGLEAYEDICHQIIVLWPTEYTIDFIEQCLVRMPEDDPEQGIDLEAFKDLLLLYGVLKRLDQFYDSSMAPFSASRPANSQLGTVDAVLAEEAVAPLPTLPAAFVGAAATPTEIDLELDLNLDIANVQEDPPKHDNLIDFDVTGYTDVGKPKADK
jgi:hypothetical protein